jgi:hypothetical protein
VVSEIGFIDEVIVEGSFSDSGADGDLIDRHLGEPVLTE